MAKCTQSKSRTSGRAKEGLFEVVNPKAGAVDVHSAEMWVCVPEGRATPNVRRFGTDTVELEAIAAWLRECGVTTVAMESTGVYWIPLFQVLENHGLEVCLVNARHAKNVPGRRKTDRLDCVWLQKLHACGLLAASFRPSAEICRLRSYLRHRANLVREQATQQQYLQKALREMNVLLDQAVSEVTGVTGLRIIEAILAGERRPEKLAALADPRVRKTADQIARALQGDYRPEHLFVLRQALQTYRFLHGLMQDCDQQVESYLKELQRQTGQENAPLPAAGVTGREKRRGNAPQYDVQAHLYRLVGVDLTRIPGIAASTAQALLSETGLSMDPWPTPKHFVSWLDLCPWSKVSAGKILGPGRRHTGNRAGQLFRQAAASLRESPTWLGAFHRRMKAKLGANSAKKATAHKLALIYYHMLQRRTEYRELGAAEYEQRFRERSIRNLRRRARQLGLDLVEADLTVKTP
jgi:transposase